MYRSRHSGQKPARRAAGYSPGRTGTRWRPDLSSRPRRRPRNLLIVWGLSPWPGSCCFGCGRRNLPIKPLARRSAYTICATALAVAVLTGEAIAQTGWLLVTPPPVPEKRTLMTVYAAGSEAEVQAAVASLPGDDQIRLVTKVYEILTIPTLAARTEAFLDALHDASAPVSRWRLVETFESAVTCEHQRQRALQSFERAAAKVRDSVPDGDELAFEEWTIFEGLSACRMSRCVPESAVSSR